MSTWRTTKPVPLFAAFLTIGVALALSGCTSPSMEAPTETLTPTATLEPSVAPTETATPEPSAVAEPAATCDSILTADAVATIVTRGLEPRPDRTTGTYSANYASVAALPDGLSCVWLKPNTDDLVQIAQGSMDAATWESTRADLIASGWTEVADPIEGTITSPDNNGTGVPEAVTWRDGTQYFAGTTVALGWIQKLAL